MKVNNRDLEALRVKVLNEIGQAIVLKAKNLAPIDQGHLRKHIVWDIEDDTIIIHTQGVPYADKMEYGSPPMVLDEREKEAVMKWAKRHDIPGWAVIRKLETKGIEAGTPEQPFRTKGNTYRPFLRPAIHQSMGEIDRILKEAFG